MTRTYQTVTHTTVGLWRHDTLLYESLMTIHHVILFLVVIVPLSFDTFLLSAALGIAGLPKGERLRTSLILTAFEAGMPIIGVLIGSGIGDVAGRYASYIAAAVIGAAGLITLKPGSKEEKEEQRMKLLAKARGIMIINLGIGISIDELAIGVSLGLLHITLLPAIVFIAIQTFLASQLGLHVGGKLSETLQERAQRVAGSMLIGVAILFVVLKATGHSL